VTSPREVVRPGSLRELAEATPRTRDRYVDFLRAFSICVVVLGHWLIAAIYRRNGEFTGQNALDVLPGLWLATWVLQVMPVFFFVGGFSNLVTADAVERRGGDYTDFIYGRVVRLMRPSAIFLAVWLPIAVGIDLLSGLSDDVLDAATTLLTRPLWFIGVYLIVIAFAPPMIRLHRRFGMEVIAAMIVGAIAVDGLSIGFGLPVLGYLNFAFVWLFVHQLGFFYADGTLPLLSRRAFWAMAIGGLAVLILLTAFGPYSPSMVGLRDERSNTNPPTFAIVALTVWQVGLVMLLRGPLTRWLAGIRAWIAVIAANTVIMTLFLWHQTSMIFASLILYPLGFPQPPIGSAQWWLVRPLWVLSLSALLAVLVVLFGRFERGRLRAEDRAAGPPRAGAGQMATIVSVSYILIAILGFAVSGMDGFVSPRGELLAFFQVNPLQNLLHLAAGALLLRSAIGGESSARKASVTTAAALALIGAGSFALSGPANILAADSGANLIHLVSALLLALPLVRGRAPQPGPKADAVEPAAGG
jgi:hypothetical protein